MKLIERGSKTRRNAEKLCIPSKKGFVAGHLRLIGGIHPARPASRSESIAADAVRFSWASGDSPESKSKYARILAEQTSGHGQVSAGTSRKYHQHDPKLNDVILAYLEYAEGYYGARADGLTQELDNIKAALRPVLRLYGRTPAREFGPFALRAVRDTMLKAGLAYTTSNPRINRIWRVFRWAGSVEMIPGTVNHNLQTVELLQRGRSKAWDPEEIKPVPIQHVEKTLPFVLKPWPRWCPSISFPLVVPARLR